VTEDREPIKNENIRKQQQQQQQENAEHEKEKEKRAYHLNRIGIIVDRNKIHESNHSEKEKNNMQEASERGCRFWL
jgi:hypothetical protein